MSGELRWRPGPGHPTLGDDEVHVWRAVLEPSRLDLAVLAGLLDEEETGRARRCRLARERTRFVAAHGVLRSVLARYTGDSAGALAFARTERGRPFLRTAAGLDFNLSHTAGTALVAVSRGRRVGVDIEHIDPAVDHLAMAQRFFGTEEAGEVARLPLDHARRLFFARWTWRESHAKALDRPLCRGLTAVGTGRAPVRAGGCSLWELPTPGQECATLAVAGDQGGPEQVRLYDYAPVAGRCAGRSGEADSGASGRGR